MDQINVRDSESSLADLEVPGVSMKMLQRDEATEAMGRH